jgi:hypothetical protein
MRNENPLHFSLLLNRKGFGEAADRAARSIMASHLFASSGSRADSLDIHLEQFKLNNQANQNDLQVFHHQSVPRP